MKTMMCLGLALLSGCVYETGYERRVITGPMAPPVAPGEVIRMEAAGVSEPVILDVLSVRGARPLTADDIVAIKTAGGSDTVISKMQNTIRQEPEVVYVEQPVVYRSYAYGPYWYPSWGFGYSSWGHRGGWGVRVGW
jgi:hypothetical protein